VRRYFGYLKRQRHKHEIMILDTVQREINTYSFISLGKFVTIFENKNNKKKQNEKAKWHIFSAFISNEPGTQYTINGK
jgi:hypothetical protein